MYKRNFTFITPHKNFHDRFNARFQSASKDEYIPNVVMTTLTKPPTATPLAADSSAESPNRTSSNEPTNTAKEKKAHFVFHGIEWYHSHRRLQLDPTETLPGELIHDISMHHSTQQLKQQRRSPYRNGSGTAPTASSQARSA